VFDISDLARPRQVGQVQTCRGSHTHSVVSAGKDRVIVYNSGTSYVRDERELVGCVDTQGDDRTALFSIDVIDIPIADPARARIVERPRVFAANGQIAGLWPGGDHGDGTQETTRTDMCHDITVFPAKNLAAGACSGNGIILDISDPLKPKRIDDVTDKGCLLALGHLQQRRHQGAVHRRIGRRPAAALPGRRPGRVGRRRVLRDRKWQAGAQEPLQATRAAERQRKLRRAQRLDRARAGPRPVCSGLVPGRD